jgi:hypothetical protein
MFLATQHINEQGGLSGILIDRLEDYMTGVRCPPEAGDSASRPMRKNGVKGSNRLGKRLPLPSAFTPACATPCIEDIILTFEV